MAEQQSADQLQVKDPNGEHAKTVALAKDDASDQTRLERKSGGSHSSLDSVARAAPTVPVPSAPENGVKATEAEEATTEVSAVDDDKLTPEIASKQKAETEGPSPVTCASLLVVHAKGITEPREVPWLPGMLAEEVVDMFLHILAVVEPPIIAILATPVSRENFGFQIPFPQALAAALTPIALLGAWTWVKHRMNARYFSAAQLLSRARSDLAGALVAVQSIADAAASAERRGFVGDDETLRMAQRGILHVKETLEDSEKCFREYIVKYGTTAGVKNI